MIWGLWLKFWGDEGGIFLGLCSSVGKLVLSGQLFCLWWRGFFFFDDLDGECMEYQVRLGQVRQVVDMEWKFGWIDGEGFVLDFRCLLRVIDLR